VFFRIEESVMLNKAKPMPNLQLLNRCDSWNHEQLISHDMVEASSDLDALGDEVDSIFNVEGLKEQRILKKSKKVRIYYMGLVKQSLRNMRI